MLFANYSTRPRALAKGQGMNTQLFGSQHSNERGQVQRIMQRSRARRHSNPAMLGFAAADAAATMLDSLQGQHGSSTAFKVASSGSTKSPVVVQQPASFAASAYAATSTTPGGRTTSRAGAHVGGRQRRTSLASPLVPPASSGRGNVADNGDTDDEYVPPT